MTFNGVAARLLYVSPGQINAVVPYAAAGRATAEVAVSYFNSPLRTSPSLFVPMADTAPAILTPSQNGSGQGSIIHYPDNRYNNADNPALPGAIVTLYATGEGEWDDSVADGSIGIAARDFVNKPVSLTVGGQSARILYAGAAPYLRGVLQVNAQLPEGIASGPQPVVLKIGEADNAEQRVTIAIR